MLQPLIHYSLHFVCPALIARYMDKPRWKQLYVIFLSTMLIDLDHLLAVPMFDPNRCSVGFHPLHSAVAICCYLVGLRFFRHRLYMRALMIGLLFHILTDLIDCAWMWSRGPTECF